MLNMLISSMFTSDVLEIMPDIITREYREKGKTYLSLFSSNLTGTLTQNKTLQERIPMALASTISTHFLDDSVLGGFMRGAAEMFKWIKSDEINAILVYKIRDMRVEFYMEFGEETDATFAKLSFMDQY